jgi:raffinose/stachyose/melibiose transport system substrate-binding protein
MRLVAGVGRWDAKGARRAIERYSDTIVTGWWVRAPARRGTKNGRGARVKEGKVMTAKWDSSFAAGALLALAVLGMPGPAAAADPIKITMWDIPESEPYTAWWKAHVEQFNKDHPDIQVTLEVFETEAYRPKIASALAAGTAADIFYLPAGPQGFQALRDGQALPLDGLLAAEKFSPAAIESCSTDGKVACLPLYIAPNLMYYNKKQFEQAGIDITKWKNPEQPTWEEFIAACDALKAAGIVPIALGNADSWPGTMYLWALQNRYGGTGELAAALNGEGGLTFSGATSFQKAAAKVAEIGQSGYLPLGYNGIGGGQKYTLFTGGQAAIIFQGPWMLGRIATDAPDGFDYGIFNFPSIADGNPDSQQDVVGGFDALFVSAKTEHPEAVATFLNSFADRDAAVSFMLDTQNISVIKEALEATKTSDNVIAKMAALVAKSPRITPWWDNYMPTAVHEESTRLIQGLFDGSVSPTDYLASVDKAAGR